MPSGVTADIAVIVTTHNYARYLGQCLHSVAAQTLKPKEVVVVDDASTDETEAAVRQFPGVRYYRVAFQNGNRARNYGFSKISSEQVVFFDADNYMEARFLEVLSRALEGDEGADFAYCDRTNFGEGDVSWYPEPPGRWRSRPFDPVLLKSANYIDLASLLRVRCFPGFDENLRRYQDWDLWLNVVLSGMGRGRYVPEPLFHYRIHRASVTRREDRDRAVWYIRRKYRLSPLGSIPVLRNSFRFYRFLRKIKSLSWRLLPGERED